MLRIALFVLLFLTDAGSGDSPLRYYRDDAGHEREVKTPEDWARRRVQILDGLQQAMGLLPDRSNLPPLDVKVLAETKGDGFTRVAISFASGDGDRVPVDLYVPTSAVKNQSRPAILALHQTSPLGKRDLAGEGKNPNMGYAPELARRGYIVLCPDYPSFGEYPHDFTADAYVSGSMKGVFNHMRCVDLLRSRDDVDGKRVGVIGHSLGGHNAMFLAAFDERLKAVVASCGWTPFGDYFNGDLTGWTSERYMPRLKSVYGLDANKVPFDFPDVVAVIAPRWFFSSSPVRDDNFAVAGVKKAAAAARPIFDLLGAAGRMQVIYPEVAHDFPPEAREQAYAFLDRALDHKAPAVPDYGAELPRIPPTEPADALKTFRVVPGFRIEQAAAEPLVRDPIAMSFDENGRLFVVEMCDYSEQDKDFLGRIRMLEDGDGDGRFEKSTVYADGLSWPTALICYGGGVFVGAAPDIYYLKDTDGDGKADARKTVFTGFERTNVQGLLNSFHWTLDGRIHGATSISGGRVRRAGAPDASALSLNGRDFSFDPKTLDLRPESGGAQHGLTFDDWGRKFVCSNSDHIQMVMFEDRYLARNPSLAAPSPRVSIAADGGQAKVFRISPVEPWRIVRTRLRVAGIVPGPVEGGGTAAGYFTGATGATIYRGDAFPAEFRGQAFIGDVGSNIIHRKVLEPDGVGFIARRADEGREFVASTDTWFRPCQFANAPDGTLYVADMYREVIEHPASLPPEIKKHLDLTSGKDRGRIYRIVPDSYQQRRPPRLGAMTTAQLVATLEHRNGWHRDTAARLLFERADAGAIEPLERLALESTLPEARMHALYALAAAKALSPRHLSAALGDEHPRVREHAVRLVESAAGVRPVQIERWLSLVDDPDSRVRYQVAFTAGSLSADVRRAALAKLLCESTPDPWIRFAAMSSVGNDAAAMLILIARSAELRERSGAPGAVRELGRQIGSQKAGADTVLAQLDERVADAPRLVEAALLGIGFDTPGGAEHLREAIPRHRRLAAWVAGRIESAAREAAPPAERVDALRWLVFESFERARPVFEICLDNRQSDDVQLAALGALDRHSSAAVGDVVARAWPGMTPRLRKAATEVVFSRPARAAALIDAVTAGKIPVAQLNMIRLRQFAQSLDGNDLLKAKAQALLSAVAVGKREDVVNRYRPALHMRGNADNGRKIFVTTCAACHRLEGVGHEIGPNLAAMASRGAEAILVNVLDPNREVTPQFVEYVVETTDGRTLSGMLAAETASSITLRRAENISDVVLRTNIRRMRSGQVSIMPEGLEQQLDVQAMADLLSYLAGVK